MKILVYNILLIFFILLLSACKKEISSSFSNGEKKIVLNSILTPDSLFTVYLSESIFTGETFFNLSGSSNNYRGINKAKVKLYNEEGYIEDLTFSNNGRYFGTVFPTNNHDYRVEVVANGFPSIQTTTTLATKIPIDSVKLISVNNDIYYSLNVKLFFTDLLETENYYYLVVLFNNTKLDIYNFGGKNIFDSNDPVFINHTDNKQYFIFNDHTFDGESYGLNIKLTQAIYDGLSNDSISYHFYLCSLNSDFYNYLDSYNKYILTTDSDHNPLPLSEPIKFYSNIENGFGIFAGYQTDIATLVYVKP